MHNWEVLEAAIPRSVSARIARFLNYSDDQIRRWRREPLAGESSRAQGHYSPLDRINDLVDALLLHHRDGAALVVNQINAHYLGLAYPDSEVLSIDCSPEERNRAVAQLLQSSARVANLLSREGITRETVFLIVQHQQLVAEIAACANQDLNRAETAHREEKNRG